MYSENMAIRLNLFTQLGSVLIHAVVILNDNEVI